MERIEEVPTDKPEWTEQFGDWLTRMRMEGVKFSLHQGQPGSL